eukprot:jgi/Mesvir1/27764/Mv07449-RA.1
MLLSQPQGLRAIFRQAQCIAATAGRAFSAREYASVAGGASPALADVQHDSGSFKNFEEVPGPKGWPWFGVVKDVSKELNHMPKFYERLYEQWPRICRFQVLGDWTLMIFDPDIIGQVYQNEPKFPQRRSLDWIAEHRKSRGIPPGMVVSNGEEWWRVRVPVQKKLMSPPDISASVATLADSVGPDLIAAVEHRLASSPANQGQGAGLNRVLQNVQELMSLYALESTGVVVFSKRMGCMDATMGDDVFRFVKAVRVFFETSSKLAFTHPLLWKKFPNRDYNRFCEAMDTLNEWASVVVQERAKRFHESGGVVDDFMSYMLASPKLTEQDAAQNGVDLLAAAVDATSTVMSWSLYHAGRFPSAQRLLQAEIDEVVGRDRLVTGDDLKRMPYLKAFVKESMRLAPIVPANSRLAIEDTIIGGYHVPKGTQLLLDNWCKARNPLYFDDPLELKPERWLATAGAPKQHHPFAFVPFGHGTRKCVGFRLAEMETHVLLATLLQKYNVEHVGKEVGEMTRLLMYPDGPISIAFHKRA